MGVTGTHEIKRRISIMQAYLNNETIQIRNYYNNLWEDLRCGSIPSFNWIEFDYRIKPAPIEYVVYIARGQSSPQILSRESFNRWLKDNDKDLIRVVHIFTDTNPQ